MGYKWISNVVPFDGAINGNAMRFNLDFVLSGAREAGSYAKTDKVQSNNPVIRELLNMAGVTRVAVAQVKETNVPYIVVTKADGASWTNLIPAISAKISSGMMIDANRNTLLANPAMNPAELKRKFMAEGDSEGLATVRAMLFIFGRNVMAHGGQIELVKFDERNKDLHIALIGNCSGCGGAFNAKASQGQGNMGTEQGLSIVFARNGALKSLVDNITFLDANPPTKQPRSYNIAEMRLTAAGS